MNEICPDCGRRISNILASGGTIEHSPEPRKPNELWLQDVGNGLWQEKWSGIGTLYREVIEE